MALVNRVHYWNKEKQTDFEVLDLQYFFSTRPISHLETDYRLDFWVFIYITEGSGIHYIDFQPYGYNKGDVIFIQVNQVHRFVVNEEVRGYVFHINEPFFYGTEGVDSSLFTAFLDDAYGCTITSFDTSEGTTNRMLAEMIYREYNKPLERMNMALIGSLFQSFVISLRGELNKGSSRNHSRDYQHFTTFRKLVEGNFTEIRNVEAYAEMMHLSKKTVNQAVRNVAGMSAKTFIINRTVLEIKRYLSQGNLMNYEIADVLGFQEAANMTRFFKKEVGVSPKSFRESIGSPSSQT